MIEAKTLERFKEVFGGRADAWGAIHGLSVQEEVTKQHYVQHLVGKTSLGIYPLQDDGRCRWATVDIDVDDLDLAVGLREALCDLGLNVGVYIERSKSKGHHVWLLFDAPVSAKNVRRILRTGLTKAGLDPGTEIFPKQDSLDEETPLGNYVNLPYFGNNGDGKRCVLRPDTLAPMPVDEFIGGLRTFPASSLELVLEALPPEEKFERRNPPGWLGELMGKSIPTGQRRPTLTKIAGAYRAGGIDVEAALIAVAAWAEKAFEEPLPVEKIEKTVRDIYERYGTRNTPNTDNGERPEPVPETEDTPPSAPVLIRLSDVTPRRVQWLWPGRIPLGKISIIAGDPGLMKSMLSLDMAARVSRGLPWPDGGTAPLGDVLLLTAEDDLDDTVRPRLDTLGADVKRITALTMIWTAEGEVAFNLREHLPMLEQAITPETRLVIIDPVLAFTGGTDTHVSAQVRGVLAPLAKLAQETRVSVTGIIHLNKKVAGNAFQRILASIDFSAAPRSVLLVGEDADDPTLRHFAVVKNNLAAPAETLTYRWSDGQGFTWAGKSDLTAHQLLVAPADGEGRTALIEAKEVLEELLSAGPMPPTEIRKAAAAAGVKEATLRVAKEALGVRSVRIGFGPGGQWMWELPSHRRGENTDPTYGSSDTEHREEPRLSESPAPPVESPDDGQRLYARSLWEAEGCPASVELSQGKTASDPETVIDTGTAADLAAFIAALEAKIAGEQEEPMR